MFSKISVDPKLRKNFTKLLKANVYVQVMSFLSIPIISRLFKPEDFGYLAVYSALVVVLASISTLRFDWLIPSVKLPNSASHLFNFGFIFCLLFTVILSVVLSQNILAYGPNSFRVLQPVWFLIPLGVILVSLFNILKGWTTRTGELEIIAKITWKQSVVKIISNLFFGFMGINGIGLILSLNMSRVIGVIFTFNLLKKTLPLLFYSNIRKANRILKVIINKAILSSIISLINAFSTNIMVVTLAIYYSSSELGLLVFANRIVAAPVGIASRALSQSFWSRAAELTRAANYTLLKKEYIYITIRLFYCALVVVLVTMIISQLTEFIFGSNWKGAGEVLLCMTPLFLGTIIFVPTNHLIALKKPQLQLIADLTRVSLIIVSILIAMYFDLPFTLAVFLCCSGSFIGYVILGALHFYAHARLLKMPKAKDVI